jgi:hypothetical protein
LERVNSCFFLHLTLFSSALNAQIMWEGGGKLSSLSVCPRDGEPEPPHQNNLRPPSPPPPTPPPHPTLRHSSLWLKLQVMSPFIHTALHILIYHNRYNMYCILPNSQTPTFTYSLVKHIFTVQYSTYSNKDKAMKHSNRTYYVRMCGYKIFLHGSHTSCRNLPKP